MSPSEPGGELSEIDTLKMIRPAAERLIRQVERTFEYHTTTMGNERVEKIFFSGELATNQLLIKYIHSQLGIECQVLDALSPSSPNVPKAATQLAPVDRLSYNLAVALALSDNTYTPNLLYTFRDKEKLRQAKKMDSAIYVVSSIILVVLACVWFWQKTVVDKKQAELDGLQAEIDTYVEPDPGATALYLEVDAEGDGVPDPGFSSRFAVTKTMLDVKASRLSALRDQWKSAAKRYEGLAILSEIKSKVEARPSVRLTSISINLGVQRDDFESSGARTVTLEGFISGDERLFELEFTSFQIEIENSPLFQLPYIISQEVERHPTVGRVLKFVIHFELQAG
ncbi:MAG: hypothetical protein D6E12_04180 [Desulfovibrio sp.]|nr:MAG: hypothetical protein D6E12_04180 [Desulfovibrio sp.]